MIKKGFTLVELLVVIAIIGILAGTVIAVINPAHFRAKARDGTRKSDLEQIRSALEMYRADNKYGIYPGGNGEAEGVLSGALSDYLSNFPSDPGSYRYYYSGSSVSYSLCAYLEKESGAAGCGGAICGSGTACNYQVNNP